MTRQVLIVEDDRSVSALVQQTLKKEGYDCLEASSLGEAREALRDRVPDLIILDRILPDGDGLDYCAEIRSQSATKTLPILFLTAKAEGEDRVNGLKIGADDYLPKPFLLEELLARIEVIFRHASPSVPPNEPSFMKWEGILLDLSKHECTVDQRPVELWPKEFKLLKLFLENRGRSLSKEYLAREIWETELGNMAGSRAIDITVQRLRQKLGKTGDLIQTIRGYGFSFKAKTRTVRKRK
jgi:DNA-binding response OmpR family regulator